MRCGATKTARQVILSGRSVLQPARSVLLAESRCRYLAKMALR
jgi:hypothetical protein